jgi:hypothetical protein
MDIVPHNTETGGHSATPWLQFEQHERDQDELAVLVAVLEQQAELQAEVVALLKQQHEQQHELLELIAQPHPGDLAWLEHVTAEWPVTIPVVSDGPWPGPIDLQPQETPAGLLLLSADALATLRALAVDGDQ